MFSEIGGISLRSFNQESATASVPIEGQKINRSLYCESCLSIIDSTSNNGYLLADLSDLNNIVLYEIKDGISLSVMDHWIAVKSDGDHLVIEAETIN